MATALATSVADATRVSQPGHHGARDRARKAREIRWPNPCKGKSIMRRYLPFALLLVPGGTFVLAALVAWRMGAGHGRVED